MPVINKLTITEQYEGFNEKHLYYGKHQMNTTCCINRDISKIFDPGIASINHMFVKTKGMMYANGSKQM